VKPRRFALTPGEPAGIGPDLCLLLASQPQPYPLIAITSRDLLLERAAQLGVAVNLLPVTLEQLPTEPHQRATCMSGTRPWASRWSAASWTRPTQPSSWKP